MIWYLDQYFTLQNGGFSNPTTPMSIIDAGRSSSYSFDYGGLEE